MAKNDLDLMGQVYLIFNNVPICNGTLVIWNSNVYSYLKNLKIKNVKVIIGRKSNYYDKYCNEATKSSAPVFQINEKNVGGSFVPITDEQILKKPEEK